MITYPKISVIIPAFNSSNFIEEALESVFCQTFAPLEIIVVNDGSTDHTNDILKKYEERINCFQQENQGPAAARNHGIRKAKGDFIAFLDSDDIWLPQKLEKQMQSLLDNPSFPMVYSRFQIFDNDTGKDVDYFPKNVRSGTLFDELLADSFITMSSVIVKSWVLADVGMFDEDLITAEDTNLYLKIAKKWKILGVDDLLVRRRSHSKNLSARIDVPIGTIENLDRIVSLYPELAPDKYPPMKKAYLLRGKGMISELLSAADNIACRRIAIHMHHMHCTDIILMLYLFLTFIPSPLLDFIRKIQSVLNIHLRRS